MLVTEFFAKTVTATVFELNNGIAYISPFWEAYMRDEGLDEADVSDLKLTREKTLEMLKLEVERRNKKNSKTKEVVDWLYDIIKNGAEPLMTQEENEIAMKMLQDMKEKIGSTIDTENKE